MPQLDIGGDGGGESSVAGIPLKYLLIGGGGLVVAWFLLRSQGQSVGGSQTPSTQAALGPNASLALGSLDTDLRQSVGDLEQMLSSQSAALSGQSSAQFNALGSAFGAANAQTNAEFQAIGSGLQATQQQLADSYTALAGHQSTPSDPHLGNPQL